MWVCGIRGIPLILSSSVRLAPPTNAPQIPELSRPSESVLPSRGWSMWHASPGAEECTTILPSKLTFKTFALCISLQ